MVVVSVIDVVVDGAVVVVIRVVAAVGSNEYALDSSHMIYKDGDILLSPAILWSLQSVSNPIELGQLPLGF
jgi:hypothetical protein